jgi:hypothetical protein
MVLEHLRLGCVAFVGAALLASAADARACGEDGNGVVVHTALGGFILGYDVDQDGTEGVLCEALTLPNGNHDVAVETFDTSTGELVKVVRKILNTQHDFVTIGMAGPSVGLVEFEHVSGLFVDQRSYVTLDPLVLNSFTDRWNPPLAATDLLDGMSSNQDGSYNAFLALHANSDTVVFASNVGANTFGPLITVSDPVFSFFNSPRLALDRARNRAVLGSSNGCVPCKPKIGFVDLVSGAQSGFPGLGFGFVNGLAVDSATRVACTSTEIDFRVQFYDLDTQAGFSVPIPGAVSQAHSGKTVEVDPIHKLFLVGQPISSTAPSGSSIQVFDEQGNFVESINGLSLPSSSVRLALQPALRTGFVVVAPNLTELQSFTY